MSIILTAKERKIYENIIEIKALSEICSKKKDFWIEQVKITIEGFNKLRDTRGQRILLTPREIIGITIIKLSFVEDKFLNEIEKLDYKEGILSKTTYKKLKELKIYISGIGDLDLLKKGLFIMLAKLSENGVFNK